MVDHTLHRIHNPAGATTTLVAMAGAGEPVSRFRSWSAHLPGEVSLVGVERPGHGTRLDERPTSDLDALAEEVAGAIQTAGLRSVVLVGHSAGSLIAHAAARLLRRRGHPLRGVVALNGRSPTVDAPIVWLDLDDRALADDVARLRPASAGLLARSDVRALFLPSIRADLELYRRSGPAPAPIDVPVVAVGGRQDALVPPMHVWPWRDATTDHAVSTIVDADHFSVLDEPEPHLATILALIERYLPNAVVTA
jgi:pyochelin biosynthetic protein PchC